MQEGIEYETGWFLVDQQGNFYLNSPVEPIRPRGHSYKDLIPLIKINDEWLTIEEIENRIGPKKS